jgi:hypothetical protein
MAIIDNTLASKIDTFNPATPLMQAAQIQNAQAEAQANQFKMQQQELGAEVRGLKPYMNTPEFAAKWAETSDRLLQRGILDPQTHEKWRNTPSPLLMQSIIAKTSDPTLDFRKDEAGREQKNVDRAFTENQRQFNATAAGGKTPPGFRLKPDGTQEFVPGGMADPTYIQSVTDAKDKGKPMSITDITKLSEEGGKFSSLKGFEEKFQDKYAGYKIPAIGSAAMAAGRYLPESVAGKDTAEAAGFWQGYDRYKNVVRNDLFGSALTATEQAAFEKADVSPAMDPAQIKKNLAAQKVIVENGLKRKANAMIEAGYKPEAIAAAYGIKLGDIGVSSKKSGAAQAGAAKPAGSVPQGAIDALKANPGRRAEFDQHYGPGTAALVLGE